MNLRPPPLRCDGSNPFARFSMETRVPRIAREVSARNPGYPPAVHAAIEALAQRIETNGLMDPPRAPDPDLAGWGRAWTEHAGETWVGTEWFFAELFFYRELAHACRFWETGRDPFAPHKEEELASARPWERVASAIAAGGTIEERLASLLDASLWGNRVDLSYTVAAHEGQGTGEHFVCDERGPAVERLARPRGVVHVLADNAGTELALDLALVDAILEAGARSVTVHVKMQPVFVSDATAHDVARTLAALRERGPALAALSGRLRTAFDAERLRVVPDPFWSGPRFLWEMPGHLAETFAAASVVLVKGDANYRRVVGDAPWAPATPFAAACRYFPAPLVCLRTLKSDSVLGLRAGHAEALDAADKDWRINGKRGLVQAYVPMGMGLGMGARVGTSRDGRAKL